MTGQHRPRKRFGQHFLHDKTIIERILDVIDPAPADRLLEIGPGQGALTWPLLERLADLHVIELDRDLARDLQSCESNSGRLHLHRGNVLEMRLEDVVPVPVRIVGNLPYNISTPLLFHLLEQLPVIIDMVFMLQEEVVDRICAAPGSKTYGRLSVMVQALCRVEKMLIVTPGAFNPPPRVTSAVARLVPLEYPLVKPDDYPFFARIVREAFGQRRKTLRNALKKLAGENDLVAAGLDPGSRPEQISVEEYIGLAVRLRK